MCTFKIFFKLSNLLLVLSHRKLSYISKKVAFVFWTRTRIAFAERVWIIHIFFSLSLSRCVMAFSDKAYHLYFICFSTGYAHPMLSVRAEIPADRSEIDSALRCQLIKMSWETSWSYTETICAQFVVDSGQFNLGPGWQRATLSSQQNHMFFC